MRTCFNTTFTLIALLFAFAPGDVYSQQWIWAVQSRFSVHSVSGWGADGVHVAITPNGSIIAGGNFGSYPNKYPCTLQLGAQSVTDSASLNPFIVSYDSMGKIKWVREWHIAPGPTSPSFADIYSIVCDKYGGVYVSGSYIADTLEIGNYKFPKGIASKSVLVKYDTAGNLIWAKDLSTSGNPYLAADSYGNIYIAGCFGTPTLTLGTTTLTNLGSDNNMFVSKLDTGGNFKWVKMVGNTTGTVLDLAFTVDYDGNLCIAGKYNFSNLKFGSITLYAPPSTTHVNLYLVKLDSSATPLWAKVLYGYDIPAIAVDSANNIYVGGGYDTSAFNLGSITLHNNGSHTLDLFLAKYDGSGNLIWAKSIGGPAEERAYSLAMGPVGNVWVLGRYTSDTLMIDTTMFIKPPVPYYNYWATDPDPMFLVNYDAAGQIRCIKSINTGGDDASYIVTDVKGNVYLGADMATDSSIAFVLGPDTLHNTGIEDIFIAKLEPCPIPASVRTITQNAGLTIYPNPVEDQLVLEGVEAGATIRISDIVGRPEYISIAKSDKMSINMTNLKTGTYILQVVEPGGVMHNQIILKK